AFDRDEAWAKATDTGEILVAGRLINPAFAAQTGFSWHHREAVGLHRAVAAALTDVVVDECTFRRVGEGSALAAATLLGGTGLVVDQYRAARNLPQLALDRIQLLATVEGHVLRELIMVAVILFRLIAEYHDAADTFGGNLPGNHRYGNP